jgi:hypothetical protein
MARGAIHVIKVDDKRFAETLDEWPNEHPDVFTNPEPAINTGVLAAILPTEGVQLTTEASEKYSNELEESGWAPKTSICALPDTKSFNA